MCRCISYLGGVLFQGLFSAPLWPSSDLVHWTSYHVPTPRPVNRTRKQIVSCTTCWQTNPQNPRFQSIWVLMDKDLTYMYLARCSICCLRVSTSRLARIKSSDILSCKFQQQSLNLRTDIFRKIPKFWSSFQTSIEAVKFPKLPNTRMVPLTVHNLETNLFLLVFVQSFADSFQLLGELVLLF